MTQAEAAEAAGVHAVHVARVESGAANVTISTLIAFAAAYGVPVHALFELVESAPPSVTPPGLVAEPRASYGRKPSRPKTRRR